MSLPDPAAGNVVLVTGASSGIGAELARQLGSIGHDLVLVARRRERLEELAEEIALAGGGAATVMAADLADATQRRRVITEAQAQGRRVVGLCNNAGFGSYGRVLELEATHEAEMVAVNVVAVHELTLAFLPAMVGRGTGAILNVASIAAFQPVPGMATYAATKAFVQSFSEARHAELAGTGVSCTTLSPGPVPTEFGQRDGAGEAQTSIPDFTMVAAGDVAEEAIRGMVRVRRSVVPGTVTKALAAGGRLVPRTVLLPATLRTLRSAGRR